MLKWNWRTSVALKPIEGVPADIADAKRIREEYLDHLSKKIDEIESRFAKLPPVDQKRNQYRKEDDVLVILSQMGKAIVTVGTEQWVRQKTRRVSEITC